MKIVPTTSTSTCLKCSLNHPVEAALLSSMFWKKSSLLPNFRIVLPKRLCFTSFPRMLARARSHFLSGYALDARRCCTHLRVTQVGCGGSRTCSSNRICPAHSAMARRCHATRKVYHFGQSVFLQLRLSWHSDRVRRLGYLQGDWHGKDISLCRLRYRDACGQHCCGRRAGKFFFVRQRRRTC